MLLVSRGGTERQALFSPVHCFLFVSLVAFGTSSPESSPNFALHDPLPSVLSHLISQTQVYV